MSKWNVSQWSSLGSGSSNGVSGPVYAIAINSTGVYVGGHFETAGGITANSIAKSDDSQWYPLGNGGTYYGMPGTVNAIAVSGSDVYIGAYFDGIPPSYIAKWDGTQWSLLGSGV